jgi:hypothetical protein
VTENHSIEVYANGLLEMAARAPEFQARWIARDLATRAGAAMNAWCDSSTTIDAFLPRVAEQIRTLVVGNLSTAVTGGVPVVAQFEI